MFNHYVDNTPLVFSALFPDLLIRRFISTPVTTTIWDTFPHTGESPFSHPHCETTQRCLWLCCVKTVRIFWHLRLYGYGLIACIWKTNLERKKWTMAHSFHWYLKPAYAVKDLSKIEHGIATRLVLGSAFSCSWWSGKTNELMSLICEFISNWQHFYSCDHWPTLCVRPLHCWVDQCIFFFFSSGVGCHPDFTFHQSEELCTRRHWWHILFPEPTWDLNSLGPCYTIWWHCSKSAQVMVCFLTAPSRYPNQFWVKIKGDLWHLP